MKIGIIGGGAAGLVTAWLLEQQHDVVLFEAQNRLGGHAHTIYLDFDGTTMPIEIGFEFFNEHLYPTFCRLLEFLAVPTQNYLLTYTYFTSDQKNMIRIPFTQGGTVFWKTLAPIQLFHLIQLRYVISRGQKILQEKKYDITVEQFIDSLFVTDSFKHNFFYPFFSTAWGATVDEFKLFAACDLLAWILPNISTKTQWYHVIDGMSSYITKLTSQLTRAQVKTGAPISHVTYENEQYIVWEKNGTSTKFDRLICATNAYEAHKLLQELPQLQEQCTVLQLFEYLASTLAVHGDHRYMPTDKKYWCNSNVEYNGTNSSLTIYNHWQLGPPIFRSWLMPGFPQPEPVYAVEHFFHAKPTVNYFKAQELLAPLQGRDSVWFAGMYTTGIDSHESAILSAINIAQKLAPGSERLASLLAV
jgi:predicted NAD/FAD-binding protein